MVSLRVIDNNGKEVLNKKNINATEIEIGADLFLVPIRLSLQRKQER